MGMNDDRHTLKIKVGQGGAVGRCHACPTPYPPKGGCRVVRRFGVAWEGGAKQSGAPAW